MSSQETVALDPKKLPRNFIVVSLLACVVCISLLATGTFSQDGFLHDLMGKWYGAYVIISISFWVTFMLAYLLGFKLRSKSSN